MLPLVLTAPWVGDKPHLTLPTPASATCQAVQEVHDQRQVSTLDADHESNCSSVV